ncbi:exported protein [Oleiphilus messinensis]|uniref:Exported protein n=1 Tax=Oleiphilus messinensis TaxID=141451 RepID=A0A1Y0I4T9_9GAMM|nr:hypothetical protein [Oleiphilus messinensis]ARU54433.1 exported protein [Oleiphilus messinensis]
MSQAAFNNKRKGIIKLVTITMVTFVFSGCSMINHMIYKTTGMVLQGYTEEHIVPFTLEQDDLEMGCALSEATTPLLMSFGRVTASPDQIGTMLYLSAGTCEEQRALEDELRYLRAIKEQRPDEAEDALIAQKRHLVKAAKRQFEGWNRLVAHYGEPGGAECPELDNEFDQFIWLAGLLSGLQSLNSEIQSTSTIGVPKNIAAKVERAAGCLEDDAWWGAPMALKATVWAMLPGAEPQGESAWERLEAADKKGIKARVRLTHVLHALAAYTKGDMERVRNVIRAHAEAIQKKPARPTHRLIDAIATYNIQALSDRLWTQNTGHRTPVGGLGTFWDDKKESNVETIELDDFL